MTRPRPAILVLGFSFLLLAVSSVWFVMAGSGPLSGSDNASTQEITTIGQSRSNSGSPAVVPTPPARIGTAVTNEPTPVAPIPVAISIPGLSVETAVIPVGVDDDGQVKIPQNIDRVGWYKFGAKPGTGIGSSVIVGHRDGRNYGKGAFYNLGTLKPGDSIAITTESGEELNYRVTGRESIVKKELPVRELFRESGQEVLTLISCSGNYVPGVGYDQNVIVTAVPNSEA